MQTPPAGALTCPSSEVPVPNAITGTPCLAQIRTTSWISAVSCAITTASGGCGASHVVEWSCWWRTACEVISRLPNRAASASMVPFSACGSGRVKLLDIAVATQISSRFRRPWQRIYKGSSDRLNQQGIDNDDRFRRQGCFEGHAAAPGAVSVLGDADRAAMDRLQRPSQHGLLQRDDGPRDRRNVAAPRDRTGLHEGAARLDL